MENGTKVKKSSKSTAKKEKSTVSKSIKKKAKEVKPLSTYMKKKQEKASEKSVPKAKIDQPGSLEDENEEEISDSSKRKSFESIKKSRARVSRNSENGTQSYHQLSNSISKAEPIASQG